MSSEPIRPWLRYLGATTLVFAGGVFLLGALHDMNSPERGGLASGVWFAAIAIFFVSAGVGIALLVPPPIVDEAFLLQQDGLLTKGSMRQCPECSGNQVQKVAVAFMQGKHTHEGSGVGVALNADGMQGVGVGSFNKTSQSAFASSLSPPQHYSTWKAYAWAIYLAGFYPGYLLLAGLHEIPKGIGFLLVPIVSPFVLVWGAGNVDSGPVLGSYASLCFALCVMARVASRKRSWWNIAVLPALKERWEKAWVCNQCGVAWLPELHAKTPQEGLLWWLKTPDATVTGPYTKTQIAQTAAAHKIQSGALAANSPEGPWRPLRIRGSK